MSSVICQYAKCIKKWDYFWNERFHAQKRVPSDRPYHSVNRNIWSIWWCFSVQLYIGVVYMYLYLLFKKVPIIPNVPIKDYSVHKEWNIFFKVFPKYQYCSKNILFAKKSAFLRDFSKIYAICPTQNEVIILLLRSTQEGSFTFHHWTSPVMCMASVYRQHQNKVQKTMFASATNLSSC